MSIHSSSPPRSSSPPASEEDDKLARALREISTLKDTIEKKCKRVPTNIGRTLRRTVLLFGSFNSLIADQDRAYVGFNILTQVVDGLKAKLSDPNCDDFDEFMSKLQNHANQGRVTDTNRIKSELPSYFLKDSEGAKLSGKDCAGRGIQNDFTGQLLSSILHDWEDEGVRLALRTGTDATVSLNNNNFYRCFYAGLKGNPDRIEKGFLRSGLLLKVWCAIFTSPSSAEDIDDTENNALDSSEPPTKHKRASKKSTRGNVATLCRLEGQVTPRTIAYAAVMLHFNLTDATAWQEEYCGVSYLALWNFIVDFFEAPSDAETKQQVNDLLAWWTKKAFPHSANGPEAKGAMANSRKLLAAQRAAQSEPGATTAYTTLQQLYAGYNCLHAFPGFSDDDGLSGSNIEIRTTSYHHVVHIDSAKTVEHQSIKLQDAYESISPFLMTTPYTSWFEIDDPLESGNEHHTVARSPIWHVFPSDPSRSSQCHEPLSSSSRQFSELQAASAPALPFDTFHAF
ncbi:hypothetical protein EV421DRAFT_1736078 [Armillaria borealis]|uniref:Fungal-type protein kinase domain-containing protein n=1 Tax=Armillaria borealis TaxID=47425 RepID=A0AA39MPQ6_9AGAR|nr:hypothetical protein EV421DRAFT_1736078 [Armillaria borealis]